jgi:hypothetical protein
MVLFHLFLVILLNCVVIFQGLAWVRSCSCPLNIQTNKAESGELFTPAMQVFFPQGE